MKLVLGLNKGVLSYKINNGKEKIAFNNIIKEDGLNYRLAITTFEKDQCLQLIHQ